MNLKWLEELWHTSCYPRKKLRGFLIVASDSPISEESLNKMHKNLNLSRRIWEVLIMTERLQWSACLERINKGEHRDMQFLTPKHAQPKTCWEQHVKYSSTISLLLREKRVKPWMRAKNPNAQEREDIQCTRAQSRCKPEWDVGDVDANGDHVDRVMMHGKKNLEYKSPDMMCELEVGLVKAWREGSQKRSNKRDGEVLETRIPWSAMSKVTKMVSH